MKDYNDARVVEAARDAEDEAYQRSTIHKPRGSFAGSGRGGRESAVVWNANWLYAQEDPTKCPDATTQNDTKKNERSEVGEEAVALSCMSKGTMAEFCASNVALNVLDRGVALQRCANAVPAQQQSWSSSQIVLVSCGKLRGTPLTNTCPVTIIDHVIQQSLDICSYAAEHGIHCGHQDEMVPLERGRDGTLPRTRRRPYQ